MVLPLWGGYRLIAADATCVEQPGAKGTTARLHYALELSSLKPRAIHVTDETVGETMRNFRPANKGGVDCRSGYSNPPCIEVMVRHYRKKLRVHRWQANSVCSADYLRLHPESEWRNAEDFLAIRKATWLLTDTRDTARPRHTESDGALAATRARRKFCEANRRHPKRNVPLICTMSYL